MAITAQTGDSHLTALIVGGGNQSGATMALRGQTITFGNGPTVASGSANVLTLTASSGVGIAGALDATGNFSVATNKFTVAAASGNTVVAGTLGVTGNVAVNTNKFTITAASGNTAIAGTLGVTGDVAVNTNKFAITASSGATTVAGLLTAQAGIQATGAEVTTEGVIWYDATAHALKYRDNTGTKTVAVAT